MLSKVCSLVDQLCKLLLPVCNSDNQSYPLAVYISGRYREMFRGGSRPPLLKQIILNNLFDAEFLHRQDHLLLLNWLVCFFWWKTIVFSHYSKLKAYSTIKCFGHYLLMVTLLCSQNSFVRPALNTWSSLLSEKSQQWDNSAFQHEPVKSIEIQNETVV